MTDVLGRVPLHPLLLATFPVLALWSANRTEVVPADVGPVLVTVLAVAAAATIVSAAVHRHLQRGALTASLALILGLIHGQVWPAGLARPALAVLAVCILAWGLIVTRMDRTTVMRLSAGLNVAGVVLVVANVLPAARAAPYVVPVPDERPAPAVSLVGEARDIFYIVPDRYGRADQLQELFGFDNGEFLDFLAAQGFEIADRSLANYNKTAHSLGSTLGLDYLDELAAAVPSDRGSDWGPVYDRLSNHELGRLLKDLGYEYIHIGNWWRPTSRPAEADLVLNYDDASEFAAVFRETTAWPAIRALAGRGQAELSRRDRIRNHTLYGFDQLDRLARERASRPRFVMAHLTIPHEPYVFAADGSYVSAAEAADRSRADNVVGQIRYANRRLTAVVEALLDRPAEEQPIIIIQADEGTHPVRYERAQRDFHWPSATNAELSEKLAILNAYFLPGLERSFVYPGITPVNTWRLLLDAYFGTDLGALPDRTFVFTDEQNLYELNDVTDRVRRP